MYESKIKPACLVALQFATAAALVLTSFPQLLAHPLGLALSAAGALFGLWAGLAFGWRKITVLPKLRRDATLITGGPYRWVRHPMYTAVLLFCAGFMLSPPAWWKAVLWLVLLAVVAEKSRMEERYLSQRFAAYANYRNRTGRFLPWWTFGRNEAND